MRGKILCLTSDRTVRQSLGRQITLRLFVFLTFASVFGVA